MNKRLEQKILDEIKNRVLQRDHELSRQKEDSEIRDATKEALAEMTALDRTEVDEIAKQVAEEMLKKQRKRKRWIIFIAIIVVIVAAILLLNKPAPKKIFTETFDNNQKGWAVFDAFEYRRYFENGSYIIETNENDWCYWDYIGIDLPDKYSVELTTTWQKGKFGDYGFSLLFDNSNYYAFRISADGTASYGKIVDKEWEITDTWKKGLTNPGDGKISNTQTLKVDNADFEYYVNNTLFREGTFDAFSPEYIGLRVCDKQKVAFNSLKIADETKGGALILNETFKNEENGWTPKEKFTKKSRFENGKYILTGNTEDYCYWSDLAVEDMGEDFDIRLKTIWLSGELSDYGFMIMYSADDYFGFELRNDGKARYLRSYNGEYTDIGDYKNCGIESDGQIAVQQFVKVRDHRFEYYVNEKLIATGELNPYRMTAIAVRVCGRQTIAFDHLTIEEK